MKHKINTGKIYLLMMRLVYILDINPWHSEHFGTYMSSTPNPLPNY